MKKWILITGILLTLLLAGSVSGAVIDEKVYSALAPCYSDWLIKSYGPIPVFDKDHAVTSRGIATGFTSFVDRDAWYKKLNRLYENTKVPVDEKFSYPRGPVIAYGYDALGSMTIGLDENQTVKQETIDEIYTYVNAQAKAEGIENLPVIFYSTPIPKLDLGRADVWRPIIGGVQTGSPAGALTVGFAASRRGQNGFITAGHIGAVGTTVYQPNTAYPVGTVTASSLGTSSDSAWVQYSNIAGQVFESSGSQPGVSGSTDPYVNLGITKSGISTGVTSGTVISQTSLYNSFFGKILYNQWYGSYSSASGDSGSPVYFKDANQQIQIVGIHWANARYSTFSPVSSVLSDLA
jgi:streptogrisin B